jgi:chromosome segregation ATPase
LEGAVFEDPLEMEIRIRVDLEMSTLQDLAQPAGAQDEDPERLRQEFEESKWVLEQKHEALEEILEKRIEMLEAALERERRASNAAKAEREREQAAQRVLSQELAIARGNVGELKSEIEHLAGVHDQTDEDMNSLRKANTRMATVIEEERLLRTAMEQSLSWRMTEPFRKVTGLFSQPRRPQNHE